MVRIDTNMMQGGYPIPKHLEAEFLSRFEPVRMEGSYTYSRVDCSVCGTELGKGACNHQRGETLPDGSVVAGIIRDPKLESVSLVADSTHAQK